MEKKFNFVYVTTNLINGKQYVGDHACNNLEKDKYYIGSGNVLYEAKNKYGKENFKREILEFFSTKQDAFDAQEKYIKQYDTLIPNGYNISPKGGMNVKGCCSEETKQKISKSNIGKKSWNKGKSGVYKEETLEKMRKPKSEEHKQKISKRLKGNTYMKGKTHSEKTKEKIRQAHLGLKTSDETKEKMSESHKGVKNFMYGISVYDRWLDLYGEEIAKEKEKQRLKKSSQSLKGQHRTEEQKLNYKLGANKRIKKICAHCNREIDPGNFKKYHGENCKQRNI